MGRISKEMRIYNKLPKEHKKREQKRTKNDEGNRTIKIRIHHSGRSANLSSGMRHRHGPGKRKGRKDKKKK